MINAASWLAIAAIASFPATAEDPVKAIRSVLDQQVVDWNKKNLDAFCNGYWKSPKLVFLSGGTKTEGWEAMRNRYKARYQGEGREMGTLVFSELEIETLGHDSAFARGRWELSRTNQDQVGGRFTLILRQFPEGWRIVHDHTSSDAKP